MRRVFVVLMAVMLITGFCAEAVIAGGYPVKPITIIVPWGAGGMSKREHANVGGAD